MIDEIIDKRAVSSFNPSTEVKDFTSHVKRDYAEGVRIINESVLELNYRSVEEDESNGKLMFNAFVDDSEEDINEDWKLKATRSMARNKAIAMTAQLTANYILPLYTAQNDEDEVDKDFSEVMRDLVEWLALPTNSNYQPSFLQLVFGMMYNPVTYAEADWYEITQKLSKAHGSQEIRDDVLSGFKLNVYGPTQILINNSYERNIQKQKCIIKRRYIEYDEAEAKYGDHPNFSSVKLGKKMIYNDDDGLFYEVYDEDHPTLVAEETYIRRRKDLEVPFIGGIYMGNDDVDNNPIRHRDNKNRPKYNIVPFGYHRIGDNYFFYKSMMNTLHWDNIRIDTMDEIVYNRGLLEVDMPIAISGVEKIDSEVVFPKSVVTLTSPDAKIQPLLPPSNLVAGFRQLEESFKAASTDSIDDVTAGQRPEADEKVGNVARAQAQARKILSGVGKNLAESMVQIGDLMKDIVINNITIPEVEELIGDNLRLKYRTILLENKMINGKLKDKDIRFDSNLIGRTMSEEEKKDANLKELEKLMKNEKVKDINKLKKSLILVNPELFAKFKFLTRIDLEEMFTRNQEFMQPLLTNLYTLLREDPLVEGEGLLRKLLYSFFQSGSEDLIKDNPEELPANIKVPGTRLGAQAQSVATAEAIKQEV